MEKFSSRRKIRGSMIVAGIVAFIIFGVVIAEQKNKISKENISTTAADMVLEGIIQYSDTSKNTLPTGAPQVAASMDILDTSLLRSDNFRLGDVIVGGDVTVTTDGDRFIPLSIVMVRGEGLPDANKKDARVMITWKTSKSAISTIRYGKNTGESAKTLNEDGYGTNHSVVLSGLDQATTYLYTIVVRDRWGGEVTSEPYAVYTGAKNVSLFELIAGALTDTFGWAIKK